MAPKSSVGGGLDTPGPGTPPPRSVAAKWQGGVVHLHPGRYLTASNPAQVSDSDGDRTAEVIIDLRRAEFTDTFGLVAVAVAAEDAITNGRTVDFRLPATPDARSWLSRMHLRRAMESLGLICELERVRELTGGDRMVELHHFDSDKPDELAETVLRILTEDDPAEAVELARSVADAASNVCEHSGSDGGWAALRQVGHGSQRLVEFAVGDAGVGLRATLCKALDVPSDIDALRLAAKEGVSGTGLANRGLGLADIARTARQRSGTMRLTSGAAHGISTPNGDMHTRELPTRYPGTLVYAKLEFESRR